MHEKKREFPWTIYSFEENPWQPFGKSFPLPFSTPRPFSILFDYFTPFLRRCKTNCYVQSNFLHDVALHFGKGRTSTLPVSPLFLVARSLHIAHLVSDWNYMIYCLYVCWLILSFPLLYLNCYGISWVWAQALVSKVFPVFFLLFRFPFLFLSYMILVVDCLYFLYSFVLLRF